MFNYYKDRISSREKKGGGESENEQKNSGIRKKIKKKGLGTVAAVCSEQLAS